MTGQLNASVAFDHWRDVQAHEKALFNRLFEHNGGIFRVRTANKSDVVYKRYGTISSGHDWHDFAESFSNAGARVADTTHCNPVAQHGSGSGHGSHHYGSYDSSPTGLPGSFGGGKQDSPCVANVQGVDYDLFPTFDDAIAGARALKASELQPTNCRECRAAGRPWCLGTSTCLPKGGRCSSCQEQVGPPGCALCPAGSAAGSGHSASFTWTMPEAEPSRCQGCAPGSARGDPTSKRYGDFREPPRLIMNQSAGLAKVCGRGCYKLTFDGSPTSFGTGRVQTADSTATTLNTSDLAVPVYVQFFDNGTSRLVSNCPACNAALCASPTCASFAPCWAPRNPWPKAFCDRLAPIQCRECQACGGGVNRAASSSNLVGVDKECASCRCNETASATDSTFVRMEPCPTLGIQQGIGTRQGQGGYCGVCKCTGCRLVSRNIELCTEQVSEHRYKADRTGLLSYETGFSGES